MTWGPGRAPTCRRTYSSSSSTFAVSRMRRPPWGMASRALTARFMTTCSICPRSAFTRPSPGVGVVRSAMSSPIRRPSRSFMSVVTALRSRTTGSSTCLRLKARSWRVRSAARPAVRWISSMPRRIGSSGFSGMQQDVGAPEDDGEEVVEIVRDPAREPADRLHLLGLLELALGLGQLVVGAAGLEEQAAVLERDRGVGGEGGGDRHVLRGEALLAGGEEAQHADHAIADLGRHREEPAVAEAPHRGPVLGVQVGMIGRIPEHQGPAGARDAAVQALADLDPWLHRHVLARAEGARDDQLVAVHEPEAHPVGVDEAPARVGDAPQEGVELLHPGQVAADLDEALQPGLARARIVQSLLEAGRHRVEGAHGGRHLAQPGLRHPGSEITAPEPRRALGERAHRAQADEQDHVGEAEQGHQQHAGDRDHGADLGPELALEALDRGGDREDTVDDGRRHDRHAMLLERQRHQVLDPAGRPGAAETVRGGVEDEPGRRRPRRGSRGSTPSPRSGSAASAPRARGRRPRASRAAAAPPRWRAAPSAR